MPKERFEATIEDFVHRITFTQDHIDDLMTAIEVVWQKRQQETGKDEEVVDKRIKDLRAQTRGIVDKIKLVNSETVIKYMEEDLMTLETQVAELEYEKNRHTQERPVNFEVVMKYAKYFLEHLDYLLLNQGDPLKRADFFSVIFDQTPTYAEIASGTSDMGKLTGINELFKLKNLNKSFLVRERGVEPPHPCGH